MYCQTYKNGLDYFEAFFDDSIFPKIMIAYIS
jgi:hypothetical protein